jgi:hypothetical protein
MVASAGTLFHDAPAGQTPGRKHAKNTILLIQ